MSVQFGSWNFEGQPPNPDYIEKVSAALAPYGPDSNEAYSKGGVKILYRAFHTTKESHRETQPHVSTSGAVITWDGRLDNRADLIGEMRDSVSSDSTDVAIVAATHEKWGTYSFAKLIGDWALSIWNPINRSLVLAKDPIGTRHLYYSIDKNQITWSTILDPLVLFAGKTFAICEEYIAGWLAHFPAAHLTPYLGIHSVPPSSFVLLRLGKHNVTKYWDFDPEKKIRYRTDAEYEEHFRVVFSKAVQRRLRSDRPVLAELSGGMDSSSIVCVADLIIAKGDADTPRLDTISWYDDSHDGVGSGINDRPYFIKVEEKRGRTGFHINLGALEQGQENEVCTQSSFVSEFDIHRLAVTPIPNRCLPRYLKRYAEYMKLQGHRVTLSGIAGEMATGGGVPNPIPELQNLLARARLFTLGHQVKAWAAKMRTYRFPLLWKAVRGFFPLALGGGLPEFIIPVAPWFSPSFVRRNRAALRGYPPRVKLFGPLPSFQDNVDKLDGERRLIAGWTVQPELLRDIRFPYLDRDLLEFMYSIPREQVVRVGERRSLMRRALIGIVPDELLNRKRKLFVPQEPPKVASRKWVNLVDVSEHIVCASLGIIDPNRYCETLQKGGGGKEISIDSLSRTLTLESWLRHLTIQRVLTTSMAANRRTYSRHSERSEEPFRAPLSAEERHRTLNPKSSAS